MELEDQTNVNQISDIARAMTTLSSTWLSSNANLLILRNVVMRHNEFYSTIDSANLLHHQGTHNNMILNQMSAALADSGEPRAFVW